MIHQPKNPKASRFRGSDGAVHMVQQSNLGTLAQCGVEFEWRDVEFVTTAEPLTCIGCMAKEK